MGADYYCVDRYLQSKEPKVPDQSWGVLGTSGDPQGQWWYEIGRWLPVLPGDLAVVERNLSAQLAWVFEVVELACVRDGVTLVSCDVEWIHHPAPRSAADPFGLSTPWPTLGWKARVTLAR